MAHSKYNRQIANFTRNIRRVYFSATDYEMRYGLGWYAVESGECQKIAEDFGVAYPAVCGVVSALSPGLPWSRNMDEARRFIARALLVGPAVKREVFGTYGRRNVEKAYELLRAGENAFEHYSVLGEFKTFNFAHCLYDATNLEYVTIDGHAANAAHYRRIGINNVRISKAEYRALARAYKLVAREIGILPLQLQAIVWVTWRNAEQQPLDLRSER